MKSYRETGEIKIEKVVPGGQGLGTRADGKKGFFWNALPEEMVTEYEVTREKSSYFEAVALKISAESARRVAPRDDCYLSTSPWQIMDYRYELEQKAAILQEIFGQALLPVTDGLDYQYRNKMEYALYWDNETGKISLAFHARGSHRKVPIGSSSIERPEILKRAQEIVAELNARHEEARRYQSLLLRCNQAGEVSGGLLENGKAHPVFNALSDTILGREYSYSPNGFFQINLPVYELALKEIKKHIRTEKVLDLYSGVGTIGLSVAGDKDLTLVESNGAAYKELAGNVNALLLGQPVARPVVTGGLPPVAPVVATGPQKQRISHSTSASTARGPAVPSSPTCAPLQRGARRGRPQGASPLANLRCTPVLAKSEECLSYIAPEQTVILDPPRAGCDKKLLEKLLEVKPQTIVYLSCNPATQARDVKILTEKYHVAHMQPYNFFPRTPHLENLVVLNISPDE